MLKWVIFIFALESPWKPLMKKLGSFLDLDITQRDPKNNLLFWLRILSILINGMVLTTGYSTMRAHGDCVGNTYAWLLLLSQEIALYIVRCFTEDSTIINSIVSPLPDISGFWVYGLSFTMFSIWPRLSMLTSICYIFLLVLSLHIFMTIGDLIFCMVLLILVLLKALFTYIWTKLGPWSIKVDLELSVIWDLFRDLYFRDKKHLALSIQSLYKWSVENKEFTILWIATFIFFFIDTLQVCISFTLTASLVTWELYYIYTLWWVPCIWLALEKRDKAISTLFMYVFLFTVTSVLLKFLYTNYVPEIEYVSDLICAVVDSNNLVWGVYFSHWLESANLDKILIHSIDCMKDPLGLDIEDDAHRYICLLDMDYASVEVSDQLVVCAQPPHYFSYIYIYSKHLLFGGWAKNLPVISADLFRGTGDVVLDAINRELFEKFIISLDIYLHYLCAKIGAIPYSCGPCGMFFSLPILEEASKDFSDWFRPNQTNYIGVVEDLRAVSSSQSIVPIYSTDTYTSFYIILVVGVLLSTLLVAVSILVARQRQYDEKTKGYECGFEPFSDARDPFDVKFYLVSILFILFEIELLFFFPWALCFSYTWCIAFLYMYLFFVVLTFTFIYEWIKRSLEW